MGELTDYMVGRVMAFRQNNDDPVFEKVVLVDVTDKDDGEIEFAFDVHEPRRRIYLRLPADAVRAALPDENEQP